MKNEKYLPTGNEMISIPELREGDGAILGLSFLHMGYKGLIEIKGGHQKNPLLKPYVKYDGKEEQIQSICWERLDYWIPGFKAKTANVEFEGVILCPVGERGFIYRLQVTGRTDRSKEVAVGLKGTWGETLHTINMSKPVTGTKDVHKNNYICENVVFEYFNAVSIFSFALTPGEGMEVLYTKSADGKSIDFTAEKQVAAASDQSPAVDFYWGLGFEEVGASTTAVEMTRKGYEKELSETRSWLSKRIITTADPDIDRIMNTNLFFNFFFASGITMDTEEFVLVTSRSPRYYVSASYWDRDSLLWSFPSILLADGAYARNILEYVFTRQIKNVGIHSRYIDGTVLEPGFELDELCAPVIALYNYVRKTGDRSILEESFTLKGVDRILKILFSKKHAEKDLYETFLQPTDDIHVYPYLTYDNVLVWRILKNLSELYAGIKSSSYIADMDERAAKTKQAIMENCVAEYKGRKIFVWSLDLKGKWNIYDEPPGSLQLLPFYGFCDAESEIYKNTVDVIRDKDYRFSFHGCNIAEIGCEHAPHPWVLSIANSLLCGRKEHCKDILMKTELDNGIACESIDETSGECTTGEAFATCAGFLAFALHHAFSQENN